MNRHFSRDKPQVKVKDIGLRGIIPHNSPVIVFDPPKSIPKKARFSVLDPPKRGSAFYRPMQKRPGNFNNNQPPSILSVMPLIKQSFYISEFACLTLSNYAKNSLLLTI